MGGQGTGTGMALEGQIEKPGDSQTKGFSRAARLLASGQDQGRRSGRVRTVDTSGNTGGQQPGSTSKANNPQAGEKSQEVSANAKNYAIALVNDKVDTEKFLDGITNSVGNNNDLLNRIARIRNLKNGIETTNNNTDEIAKELDVIGKTVSSQQFSKIAAASLKQSSNGNSQKAATTSSAGLQLSERGVNLELDRIQKNLSVTPDFKRGKFGGFVKGVTEYAADTALAKLAAELKTKNTTIDSAIRHGAHDAAREISKKVSDAYKKDAPELVKVQENLQNALINATAIFDEKNPKQALPTNYQVFIERLKNLSSEYAQLATDKTMHKEEKKSLESDY